MTAYIGRCRHNSRAIERASSGADLIWLVHAGDERVRINQRQALRQNLGVPNTEAETETARGIWRPQPTGDVDNIV